MSDETNNSLPPSNMQALMQKISGVAIAIATYLKFNVARIA